MKTTSRTIRRYRMLIADDDLFFRQALVAAFKDSGFDIVEAEDGSSALECMKKQPLDLAIIDFHMPKINAAMIMAHLREEEIALPVIVITGDDTLETERQARSGSPVCFFVKPFSLQDVRLAAEKLMHHAENRHRSFEHASIGTASAWEGVRHR